MNRAQEYEALLAELADTPKELEMIVNKAMNRRKTSQKKHRVWGVSLGSLAACFAGFVLLVNLSVPFARACGNIPLLRELALAVSWSPSLSAAVENEYVQPIEQAQTKDGVTATVEYVIVDRKQLNLFLTLDSDLTDSLSYGYDLEVPGAEMGWSSSAGDFQAKNGELRRLQVNFMDIDVPDTLVLHLSVYDSTSDWEPSEVPEPDTSLFETPVHDPEYLAEFTFTLRFDPYFTAQGEIIPVNTVFQLDGQTFTLTEVELYPTHLRVNLDDDPDNTAWLKGLELYLENERGERFESSVNGISASGDPDGEGYATFWLDSPFFSQGEELTLHITSAQWLDKDAPPVRLDLKQETAENLPKGVRFLKAEQHPDGWMVYFTGPKSPDGPMGQIFTGPFRDEAGNEYEICQYGSSYGYRDPETGAWTDDKTVFTENFPLAGFHGDVVYLEPVFHRITAFTPTVSVKIK